MSPNHNHIHTGQVCSTANEFSSEAKKQRNTEITLWGFGMHVPHLKVGLLRGQVPTGNEQTMARGPMWGQSWGTLHENCPRTPKQFSVTKNPRCKATNRHISLVSTWSDLRGLKIIWRFRQLWNRSMFDSSTLPHLTCKKAQQMFSLWVFPAQRSCWPNGLKRQVQHLQLFLFSASNMGHSTKLDWSKDFNLGKLYCKSQIFQTSSSFPATAYEIGTIS